MGWGGKKTHKVVGGKIKAVENLTSLSNELQAGDDGTLYSFSGDNGQTADFGAAEANIEFDVNHWQNKLGLNQLTGYTNANTSQLDGPNKIAGAWTTGDIDAFLSGSSLGEYFNWSAGSGTAQLVLDLGSNTQVDSFTMYSDASSNWPNFTGDVLVIEGSTTSDVAGFSTIYTATGSNYDLSTNDNATQNLDVPGSYRWIRFKTLGTANSQNFTGGVLLNQNVPASVSNSVNTAVVSGANTFSSGTLTVKDEFGVSLADAQINVADNIDGGGFGAFVSLDTFKALGNRVATTSYALKFQLVGTPSLKDITINTPQAILTLNNNLVEMLIDSIRKVALSSSGTVELDDSTTPATPVDGVTIYSEAGVLKYIDSTGIVRTITVI